MEWNAVGISNLVERDDVKSFEMLSLRKYATIKTGEMVSWLILQFHLLPKIYQFLRIPKSLKAMCILALVRMFTPNSRQRVQSRLLNV